jgi:tungstate transport system substrate-binding protein
LKRIFQIASGFIVALAMLTGTAHAEQSIRVASTTSTENSGLFAYLLPKFTAASGIEVKVIAVGTGQALRLGKRGDVDVVLVHHRPSEDAFIREGYGIDRRDVMYNDFVIIGPKADPAGIDKNADAAMALRSIASKKLPFVSRGDDSGTHRRERSLWAAAGLSPWKSMDGWYRETGSGMGAALNTATAMNAYILSDRATWMHFRNRGSLKILVHGDKRLFNPYGVMIVNPKRHPHVKLSLARTFLDWLTGDQGQRTIAAFRIDGKQVFFPNKTTTTQ